MYVTQLLTTPRYNISPAPLPPTFGKFICKPVFLVSTFNLYPSPTSQPVGRQPAGDIKKTTMQPISYSVKKAKLRGRDRLIFTINGVKINALNLDSALGTYRQMMELKPC